MLKKFFVFLFIFILMGCFCMKAIAENSGAQTISNKYFSFIMPKDVQGTYTVDKMDNDSIYILEKVSAKSKEGGFAFGFKIYKNPEDYVGFDGYSKIGELTDKKGTIYDMVLTRPDEIRYAEGETVAKNYDKLYNLAENIEIKGVNGNTYKKGQGMKGKDLYGEVLKKYKKEAEKNWINSYYQRAGFAYYDINSDGIEELFIADMKKGNIYDVFTMANREPINALNGYSNLFVCNDVFLCTNVVKSRNEEVFSIYSLRQNSKKLYVHEKLMYNKDKNKANPWFRFNTFANSYENISKEKYKEIKAGYNNYKKLDYTPLSTVKNN